jgi:hypothetical protein
MLSNYNGFRGTQRFCSEHMDDSFLAHKFQVVVELHPGAHVVQHVDKVFREWLVKFPQ